MDSACEIGKSTGLADAFHPSGKQYYRQYSYIFNTIVFNHFNIFQLFLQFFFVPPDSCQTASSHRFLENLGDLTCCLSTSNFYGHKMDCYASERLELHGVVFVLATSIECLLKDPKSRLRTICVFAGSSPIPSNPSILEGMHDAVIVTAVEALVNFGTSVQNVFCSAMNH